MPLEHARLPITPPGRDRKILADDAVALRVEQPYRALSFQAGSRGRIKQRQEHQRASLPETKLKEWVPIRQWWLELQLRQISGLPRRFAKARLQPFEVRAARRL